MHVGGLKRGLTRGSPWQSPVYHGLEGPNGRLTSQLLGQLIAQACSCPTEPAMNIVCCGQTLPMFSRSMCSVHLSHMLGFFQFYFIHCF